MRNFSYYEDMKVLRKGRMDCYQLQLLQSAPKDIEPGTGAPLQMTDKRRTDFTSSRFQRGPMTNLSVPNSLAPAGDSIQSSIGTSTSSIVVDPPPPPATPPGGRGAVPDVVDDAPADAIIVPEAPEGTAPPPSPPRSIAAVAAA